MTGKYGTGFDGQFVAIHQAAVAIVEATVFTAPSVVSVPATKAQLVADATEFGQWATASKWATAALVWAWVKPGAGWGGSETSKTGGLMSQTQLAELSIKGLKSATSVGAYWTAWQWAIDNGHAKPSTKGQVAVLPTIEWDVAQDLIKNGPAAIKVPPTNDEPIGTPLQQTITATLASIEKNGLNVADAFVLVKSVMARYGVAIKAEELDAGWNQTTR